MSVRTTCAFALVVSALMAPNAAEAQIGRGWLERLSGPGPFTGLTVEARLVCLTTAAVTEQQSVTIQRVGEVLADRPGGRLTLALREDATAWVTGVGCHFLPDRDQPRLELGLQFSSLGSTDNVLNYSDRPGLSQSDLEVDLRTFMITADIRVNRVLDVGAAIGRARFSSDSDLFPAFSRTMYQPMRLTTRPLVAFWPGRLPNLLVVQFDGTRFKGGFRAEDFGAVPGTYREPGEMNWAWALKLDLTTLLWW